MFNLKCRSTKHFLLWESKKAYAAYENTQNTHDNVTNRTVCHYYNSKHNSEFLRLTLFCFFALQYIDIFQVI